MNASLTIVEDQGKGKNFLIFYVTGEDERLAHGLSSALSSKFRVILVRAKNISSRNWQECSETLVDLLNKLKIRQAAFISFGATAFLVQDLALKSSKLVRKAIFVNPKAVSGAIPWLKRRVGVYSHLHRVRCPVLVVKRLDTGTFVAQQVQLLLAALPNAWAVNLATKDTLSELKAEILVFDSLPVRRSQVEKN